MNAVDTNVLVRFLAQDDPEQFVRARRLFETESVFLSLTVILESFWVLGKRLGLSQPAALRLLQAVSRLPQVDVEDVERFDRALALTEQGMGFADALHLAATGPDMRFATFDRRLTRVAGRAGMTGVFVP